MTAEEKLSPHNDSLTAGKRPQPLSILQKFTKFRESRPDASFIFSLWFGTRFLILFVMLGIAPLLPVPPDVMPVFGDWSVFAAWDSDFIGRSPRRVIGLRSMVSSTIPLPFFPSTLY